MHTPVQTKPPLRAMMTEQTLFSFMIAASGITWLEKLGERQGSVVWSHRIAMNPPPHTHTPKSAKVKENKHWIRIGKLIKIKE